MSSAKKLWKCKQSENMKCFIFGVTELSTIFFMLFCLLFSLHGSIIYLCLDLGESELLFLVDKDFPLQLPVCLLLQLSKADL